MYREGRMWLWILGCAVPLYGVTTLLRVGSGPARPTIDTSVPVDYAVAAAKSLDANDARWGRRVLSETPTKALAEWARRKRPQAAEVSSAVEDTLAVLDDLRQRARGPGDRAALLPLVYDPDLSLRASLHASFLELHPGLGWPDAHTEDPGLAGASREGDAAGRHSVIAYTDPSIQSAIDGWMATYFHRLPLLRDALAVGWGEKGDIRVLDAATLDVGMRREGDLRWPPEDARDVPVRFDPWGENPEPAVGVRERFLGYPVTLQVADPRELVGVKAVLRVRRRWKWQVVSSLVSSPEKPLQPLNVPPDTVCLLPRGPLDPDAAHEVTFTLARRTCRWEFRTGSAGADVEILLALLAHPHPTHRDIARDQLRTLDSRWASALPHLRYRADFEWSDRDLLEKVAARVGGAPSTVRGKTVEDCLADWREGPRWKRLAALATAGEFLEQVRPRTADVTALDGASAEAAASLGLLREGLTDADEAARATAVRTLRRTRSRHATWEGELLERLRDPSAEVRGLAIEALGDLEPRDASVHGAVYDRLLDEDEDVRWDAALAVLHRNGSGMQLLRVLVEASASRSGERRREAAGALARFRGEPAAREALERLTRDRLERVRGQASVALDDEGK